MQWIYGERKDFICFQRLYLPFQKWGICLHCATAMHYYHCSYCVTTESRDKYPCFDLIKKEFEVTKRVIRIRKSTKNRQYNGQKKGSKGQTTINKTYRCFVWIMNTVPKVGVRKCLMLVEVECLLDMMMLYYWSYYKHRLFFRFANFSHSFSKYRESRLE